MCPSVWTRESVSGSSVVTVRGSRPWPRWSGAGVGERPGSSRSVSGTVGYLLQDPRSGAPTSTGLERVLSARELDVLVRRLRKAERQMASPDEKVGTKAIERYPRIEAEFIAAGGYAAESEAYAIAANLGLDEALINQEIGTLS